MNSEDYKHDAQETLAFGLTMGTGMLIGLGMALVGVFKTFDIKLIGITLFIIVIFLGAMTALTWEYLNDKKKQKAIRNNSDCFFISPSFLSKLKFLHYITTLSDRLVL